MLSIHLRIVKMCSRFTASPVSLSIHPVFSRVVCETHSRQDEGRKSPLRGRIIHEAVFSQRHRKAADNLSLSIYPHVLRDTDSGHTNTGPGINCPLSLTPSAAD